LLLLESQLMSGVLRMAWTERENGTASSACEPRASSALVLGALSRLVGRFVIAFHGGGSLLRGWWRTDWFLQERVS
jgi:hypothetical protein